MTSQLPTAFQTWLDVLAQSGKSRDTCGAYQRGIRHFWRWYTHVYQTPFDPDRVMPRDIRDWKAHQQQVDGAAPATVNQRLSAVKQFFRWAQQNDWCRRNPTADTHAIRWQPGKMGVFAYSLESA